MAARLSRTRLPRQAPWRDFDATIVPHSPRFADESVFPVGNGFIGIRVGEEARPELRDNHCEESDPFDMPETGSAAGVAWSNASDVHGMSDIGLKHQATPESERNQGAEHDGR